MSAYAKSKTLAERAAWDFMAREGGDMELAVVNPVGVFGPALGADISTSIEIVRRMMDGALPALPRISFGVVDVRDVADLHLLAMTHPDAAGERYLAVAGEFVALREIGLMLKRRMGDGRQPRAHARAARLAAAPARQLRQVDRPDRARAGQAQERDGRQGAPRAGVDAALGRGRRHRHRREPRQAGPAQARRGPPEPVRLLLNIAFGAAVSLAVLYTLWHFFGGLGLVYGMPVLSVFAYPIMDIVAGYPRFVSGLVLRKVAGRYFEYRGMSLDIDIDADAACWIRTSDVRKVVPALPVEAVLVRLYAGQVKESGDPRVWRITVDALTQFLAKSTGADTTKFAAWLEKDVARPARNKRARGLTSPR